MSLKALADKVLLRLEERKNLSQKQNMVGQEFGTVIPFPLTQDAIDDYQERAAIMEYDAGIPRQEAEIIAFADVTRTYERKKT